MRVFAEFIEEDGLLFRTKTLLQYGDSWELIGSIVMKNPGSAKQGTVLDEIERKSINKFYGKEIDFEHWSVTEADQTMRQILPIFSGSYVCEERKLNGIIQIFNLMNICDKDVHLAHSKANTCFSRFLFPSIDICITEFQNKPVYLGFFDFYTNKKSTHFLKLRELAVHFFEYVKQSKFDYLEDDFLINNQYYHKNFFYHPQALVLKPKLREKYLPVLNKFYNLLIQ